MKQKTVSTEISLSGKGLHTGKETTIIIKPAKSNTGYVFVRTDLPGNPIIHAVANNVVDTSRGTTIAENGCTVSTIEHLLAAVYSFGIDNAEFHISGPEVPILDGSSKYYIEQLQKIGAVDQDADVTVRNIDEEISYTYQNTSITLMPSDKLSLDVYIDYGVESVPPQTAVLNDVKDFASQISVCRTFVFLSEIEQLLKLDLIKGGDLDNAIVIVDKLLSQEDYNRIASLCGKETMKVQDGGILNNLKLQYENEPARHKLLDVIGDIALCGFRFNAKIKAVRPGHKANTELSKQLRQYLLNNK